MGFQKGLQPPFVVTACYMLEYTRPFSYYVRVVIPCKSTINSSRMHAGGAEGRNIEAGQMCRVFGITPWANRSCTVMSLRVRFGHSAILPNPLWAVGCWGAWTLDVAPVNWPGCCGAGMDVLELPVPEVLDLATRPLPGYMSPVDGRIPDSDLLL